MQQNSKYTTKFKKNTVLKHRNVYDCNTNHPERLAYTFVRISVKNLDLTFRFLRVKAEKIRFLGVKSRNSRRKIRFWLWVLRRKNRISWSEKSKFGFWEGKKCDFDLTFWILGVKKLKKSDFLEWKVEIWEEETRFWLGSWSEKLNLGSEKKRTGLLEWKIED